MTTRRCAHGSNNAHNSRGGGVRLFGVCLTEGVGVMKKSASMKCLSSSARPSSTGASSSIDPSCERPADANAVLGYASHDAAHASSSSISRKKGVPWTEKEHRMFLLGLKKLGKGDWRGIARNFVVSRTPTQVASHAQKYFIRQSNASRKKRRSSLFDMPIDQITVHEEQLMPRSPPNEPENTNHLITLHHNDLRLPYLLETPTTKYAAEQVGRISSNRSAIAMARILPCLSSSAHTILVPKSEYFYQRRGDEESSRDFKAHSSCSKGSIRSRGGRRRIQVQH